MPSGSGGCSSPQPTGHEAFRGGSEASEGGEEPGAEPHGGAGEKNQRAGQPNGGIGPRGRVRAHGRTVISIIIIHYV